MVEWRRSAPGTRSKRRNELNFRSAKVEIDVLRAKAAEGMIALAYVDEAGFSQVHPNRSAWTPRGERHLIEAKRGKRLNVLAALLLAMKVGRRLITLLQLIAKENYRHREGISKPRKPRPKPHKHMT